MPLKLIYHDVYDLNLGPHVFPAQKYRLIRQRLLSENLAGPGGFLAPQPASNADILRVHHPGYWTRLRHGTLTQSELAQLELPYSSAMVDAFVLAAGGTTLAARQAMQDGAACNIGGGFHHAFPDHGEGFCAIHDVAVAIRCLQYEGKIQRAMVIDTDVHHGNGTAAIFQNDASVFTFSIHQFNNYPAVKPPSNLDIHLDDGVEDAEYLKKLAEGMRIAVEQFHPELIVYVAGADPYCEDQLGGLRLTIDGLQARDELVFRLAREKGIPIASTFAGGYARQVDDTVTIHTNTIKAAMKNC